MTTNHYRWRAICFAITVLSPVLTLAGTASRAQTSSNTVQQVLGNRRPLPLPTDPYERSQADQLYSEQLRDQSLQSQSQAAQGQQQMIDQSGRQLQQNLQAQRQQDTLSQQQSESYLLQGLQMQHLNRHFGRH
jgi:hypothetical protein